MQQNSDVIVVRTTDSSSSGIDLLKELPPHVQENPIFKTPLLTGALPTLAEMIAIAASLISEMSRIQALPDKCHSRIIRTMYPRNEEDNVSTVEMESSTFPAFNTWSASMWFQLLEADQVHGKRATVFRMIEWMGFVSWYEAETKLIAKSPPQTKRGRLKKRLSSIVIDRYLNDEYESNTSEALPAHRESKLRKREQLIKVIHRGRRLKAMVDMTSSGILLDHNIWYVL